MGALKYQNSKSHILQICTGTQWKYICAKPNSTFWSENEARVACYEMGMSWEEGSGNTNWNCYLTFYFRIELRTTVSNSLNTYHKTFSCLGVEERLIDCSVNDNYDCYFGPYYYVTVHCLSGIFYYKLLILLFLYSYSIL